MVAVGIGTSLLIGEKAAGISSAVKLGDAERSHEHAVRSFLR